MDACPKCDAPLAGTESECPACGVVIAKAVVAASRAQRAVPPVPPSPSRPSGVSERTLRLLQETGIWVHCLAAVVLLASALCLLGSVLLLIQTAADAAEAPEWLPTALAVTLASLVLAIGTIGVGWRLAAFASALSPRDRRLREADLRSVAESHLRLWRWILGSYLALILAGVAARLLISA